MKSVRAVSDFAKQEVQQAVDALATCLQKALTQASFGERERAALELTNEAVRRVLQADLQRIADGFGEGFCDEVEISGETYRRHELGGAQYYCLCGTLEIQRDTFRLVGVHNGPTVVPLELEAGLIEGATPELARNLAHGYAEHDLRTHAQQLEVAHRVAPTRATMERMACAIAASAHVAAPKLEPMLRRAEKLPEGAHAVVLGLDRTSVPMAEAATRTSTEPLRKRKRPYQRRPPEPIEVKWRMAYVGTVSVVDRNGEALVTRRYAASAGEDEAALVERMMQDVKWMRGQQRGLRVGVVQDGAPEMWNLVRNGLEKLRSAGVLRTWDEAIDLYHLLERLGEAVGLVRQSDGGRRLAQWREDLLGDDCAIDRIEAFLCIYRGQVSGKNLEKYDEHLTYIENNKDRMNYAALIRRGLPLGSGVTESAAKNVIGMRAKRSGQRWSEPGLRGVLGLRALLKSDRLDRFWPFFSRDYAANVNMVQLAG